MSLYYNHFFICRNCAVFVPIQPRCWYADNTQVRILEIYRDQEAYQSHIKSDHFQTYKQGTLHMVKNLELIDMDPLDPEAMPFIFKK